MRFPRCGLAGRPRRGDRRRHVAPWRRQYPGLWARRRAPGWTLAVSGSLVAVLFHIDHPAGAVAALAPAVALYSLALRRSRTQQLLAAAVAAVIVADALHSGPPTIVQTLGHAMLVAIPLLGAEAMRTHRSYLSLLSERLELAERTREQEAQRRAEQERMRIARELTTSSPIR